MFFSLLIDARRYGNFEKILAKCYDPEFLHRLLNDMEFNDRNSRDKWQTRCEKNFVFSFFFFFSTLKELTLYTILQIPNFHEILRFDIFSSATPTINKQQTVSSTNSKFSTIFRFRRLLNKCVTIWRIWRKWINKRGEHEQMTGCSSCKNKIVERWS